MNWSKNKSFILLSLFLGIFILTSCSANEKKVSVSKLQEDLINKNSFIRQNELEINDFEIVKRQTTVEDKIDTVWIEVNASNESFEGHMYYVMVYGLYNDGWMLDSLVDDNIDLWEFTPLCGLTEEEIALYIPDDAVVLDNMVDLEYGTQIVTYTYEEPHKFCNIIHNEQIGFYFGWNSYSLDMGKWTYTEPVDAGSYEIWDIDGTWQFMESGDGYYAEINFNINGFAPGGIAFDNNFDNDEFEVNGTYNYYARTSWYLGTFGGEDEGPLKVEYVEERNGEKGYKIWPKVWVMGEREYIFVQYDSVILKGGMEPKRL